MLHDLKFCACAVVWCTLWSAVCNAPMLLTASHSVDTSANRLCTAHMRILQIVIKFLGEPLLLLVLVTLSALL